MLKPSSSVCNMRCEYCFYHSLADSRENFSYGLMSLDTFKRTFIKAAEFTKGMPINISFQGGEPLLRGLDFFWEAVDYARHNNKYKSQINYAIQTNGLLIDKDWCDFFIINNFLVGVSLDGSSTENIYRIDSSGNPTFNTVMQNIKLLQQSGAAYNILTVLTPLVAQNIGKVYQFFVSNGCKHLQFIPCLSPLGQPKSGYTLTSGQYTQYLFDLFGLYLKDYMDNNYVSIRHFDNLVRLANGLPAEQCGMNGHCTHQFVIEGDGTVFPCDFYCLDQYSLGNIADTDFDSLSRHPIAIDFIKSSLLIDKKCQQCDYFLLCYGGCKREALDIDKCESYKKFLPHAIPHLRRMR